MAILPNTHYGITDITNNVESVDEMEEDYESVTTSEMALVKLLHECPPNQYIYLRAAYREKLVIEVYQLPLSPYVVVTPDEFPEERLKITMDFIALSSKFWPKAHGVN